MTVKELIEKLQKLDQNKEIKILQDMVYIRRFEVETYDYNGYDFYYFD